MNNKKCSFIGHRKICITESLEKHLYSIVEKLIHDENADTFIFGSKSEFDLLCYEIVTLLKVKYPNIKRVYVRAEYPYIDDHYEKCILEKYEEKYFPTEIINAGRLSYVERNFKMIDQSDVCVFYYDTKYILSESVKKTKSGTEIAYKYALSKHRKTINVLY